jgi:hypothetical protein
MIEILTTHYKLEYELNFFELYFLSLDFFLIFVI